MKIFHVDVKTTICMYINARVLISAGFCGKQIVCFRRFVIYVAYVYVEDSGSKMNNKFVYFFLRKSVVIFVIGLCTVTDID